MSGNLLNQLKEIISPNLISKLSKRYDESEVLLRKSVETGISTVLIGLNNIIENVDLFEEIIESIVKTKFYEEVKLENSKSLLANNSFIEEGETPLAMLFLNKKGRLSEMISNELVVKSETASAVFNLSIMVVLTYLKNKNQKANDLQVILGEQKIIISKAIPEGIQIMLGFSIGEDIEEFADEENNRFGFASPFFNFLLKQKE